MCLAVPGKVIDIQGDDPFLRTARVSFAGVIKNVSLACAPEAKLGDYVLVHVGVAISIVDEKEAEETYAYLKEMGELEGLDAVPGTAEGAGGTSALPRTVDRASATSVGPATPLAAQAQAWSDGAERSPRPTPLHSAERSPRPTPPQSAERREGKR